MKSAVLGLFVAFLLFLSACAHALLGWPQFPGILAAAEVDRSVIAALAVGWYFGSASMLAFAAVVWHQALRRLNDKQVQTGALWPVSIMYIIFGSLAFYLRAFNPHFLLFVATGVLVGLFILACKGWTSRANAG